MITLGGIEISDNMYLGGVIESKQIEHEQVRTVEGISRLRTVPTPGGRELTLGTTNDKGVMGIWCQSVIEEVKALEATNQVLTLDHHGTIYLIKITDTSDFQPLFQWEPSSPKKHWVGNIKMIEV